MVGQYYKNALMAVLTFTVRGKNTKRYKLSRRNSFLKKIKPRLRFSFQIHNAVARFDFGHRLKVFYGPVDSALLEATLRSNRREERTN